MTVNTKTAMKTEINTNFPDNTTGLITPAITRTTHSDEVDSWQQATATRSVTGATDTIVVGDFGNLISYNNAGGVAVSIAQAIGSFANFNVFVKNIGVGPVTITPTVSTIDGAATFTVNNGSFAWIISDGTNYQVYKGLFGIIPGVQGITGSPTGNPTAALSSLTVQGNAVSANGRDYLVSIGLTSAVGSGGTVGNDKVAEYIGMVGNSGTSNIWALNPLITQSAASGTYDAQTVEIDFNNNNANRGESDGGAGLATPVSYGLTFGNSGAFRCTAAIGIFSAVSKIWNRGIVISSDSVKQSSFQDLANASVSLDIRGTHTYGLDTNAGTFTFPVRLGNATSIAWRNAANNADVDCIKLNSGNNVEIGVGAGLVITDQTFLPVNNNVQTCGIAANRWLSLFSSAIALAAPTTQTAATYSIATTDYMVDFNGSGSITVTLPTASTSTGRILRLKTIANQTVVSASSNVVPLAGGGAGTAILAATAGKWADLQSDGTNWRITASN